MDIMGSMSEVGHVSYVHDLVKALSRPRSDFRKWNRVS